MPDTVFGTGNSAETKQTEIHQGDKILVEKNKLYVAETNKYI